MKGCFLGCFFNVIFGSLSHPLFKFSNICCRHLAITKLDIYILFLCVSLPRLTMVVSISSFLYFLRQRLSLNLEFTNWTQLTAQGPSRVCLTHGCISDAHSHTLSSTVLGFWAQIFIVVWQPSTNWATSVCLILLILHSPTAYCILLIQCSLRKHAQASEDGQMLHWLLKRPCKEPTSWLSFLKPPLLLADIWNYVKRLCFILSINVTNPNSHFSHDYSMTEERGQKHLVCNPNHNKMIRPDSKHKCAIE